ncbi:MAG: hypothetical protein EOO00_13055 [Chitinophagaceae bacterium]|nr:MAG: hypothetical protein EOO00_13055 [Chitinophagaceae bacterium]
MNMNDDDNRRHRDEADGEKDIKLTVKAAQDFIEQGIMHEKEALKYFNLPKNVYDRFKTVRDKP